tara:strand:+ start:2121 stop:2285 length:165 start_codon:yes stop_codon:yes gene_type:complete
MILWFVKDYFLSMSLRRIAGLCLPLEGRGLQVGFSRTGRLSYFPFSDGRLAGES